MCIHDYKLRKRRILCVEDDRDMCHLLEVLLGGAGYDVACSTTLAGGLSLAAIQCFDLYLLDVVLPDGSGLDLARLIRAFDAGTPLVFLSARAFPEDIKRGMKAGAQAYVVKPMDNRNLLETIGYLVEEAGLRAAGPVARPFAAATM